MATEYTYTNEDWLEMMKEYQQNKTDEGFMNLYTELKPIAVILGRSLAEDNKGYGLPVADFINEAEFSIWKLTEVYDVEKGGSVPAMLKQLAKWAVSDNLIRPLKSKQRLFDKEALYAANSGESYSSDDTTSVMENVADPTADFTSAIEEEESENIYNLVEEMLEEFSADYSEDDTFIVSEIFNILKREPDANKKVVNTELAAVFPELKSATLRKKKQRALDRFTTFCQDSGYTSFDMSQF